MVKTKSQINNIARRYAEVLAKKGIRAKKIILYGSYARGTPNKWSDLDFIVISPDLKKYNFLQRLIKLSQSTIDFNESLDVHGYTPEEASNDEDKSSALWDIARKTGKTVYSK